MEKEQGRVRRPWSEVAHPDGSTQMYTLGEFFDCIRLSKRWSPKALQFIAQGRLVGLPDEEADIAILVVPTAIRAVFSPVSTSPDDATIQMPEFEFEGWLLGEYSERIWVRGELRINSIEGTEPNECTLYRLAPGEEMGTVRTSENTWEHYPLM
ncbi:hypothetical protein ACWCPS_00285 [Streptomyces mauvecolor]